MRFVVYEEMLSRYETDGIQLDLSTFIPFCRFDEVNELAPILTQWIRDLRNVANKAGQQQGRKKRIYVDIPSHPDAWRLLGYDVAAWVSEGLVQGLVCRAGLHTGVSHSHDVGDAVKVAGGTSCRVFAGMSCTLERQVRHYATAPMIWAAVANAYRQGADGFGFVDAFFGPNGWPWTAQEHNTIRLLDQPELLATADKHYRAPAVIRSTEWLPGVAPQLPIELHEGKPVTVVFWVSDDLRNGWDHGRVDSVRLCVRISHIEAALNTIRIQLNDQTLPDTMLELNDLGYRLNERSSVHPYGYIYEYDLTPEYFPKCDVNSITVTLTKRDKNITASFALSDVDCMIKYRLHRHFRREPLEY